ncbi:Terpene synthase family, metal binding domain [Myxococcus fulvus]|uniref:Terpene synthase n=1 Tax=Myxococcus fulvus TaxID=33 RepID=A0A511T9M3_MYXFU|nr:hypothetical protein [Myxococcus fulvus]AKF85685.1 hypothetical protein MFUL124B02_14525 [Myxococcus fulvus 124B02]GEN10172.1 hypothetical protein MFU01_52090 [Myxococcus fulvus]SEU35252.1 Terpene synthase family, metal binding domain [Myxococcus fulvus]
MKPASSPAVRERRFPSAVHPAVEELELHGLQWCQRFGMLPNEERTEVFKLSKFGWLGGRTYGRVGFEEACLATRYLIWLFMNDDWTDTLPLEQVRVHEQHLLGVLEGADPADREVVPTVSALRDVWKDVQAMAAPLCQQRFKLHLGKYIRSTTWEAGNRRVLRVPDLEAYLEMRLVTGAMDSVLDLIEITQHLCLPDAVLRHEVVAEMALCVCHLINWSNDVGSLEREARQGDVHNLVMVLRQQHELSMEEAIRRATRMYDEMLERFVALERRLPSFGAEEDAALRLYVVGLEDWLQGYEDWFREDSQRYALDSWGLGGMVSNRGVPSSNS